ncbi:MAG: diguanylate cyclase [Deinococcota bacterium]
MAKPQQIPPEDATTTKTPDKGSSSTGAHAQEPAGDATQHDVKHDAKLAPPVEPGLKKTLERVLEMDILTLADLSDADYQTSLGDHQQLLGPEQRRLSPSELLAKLPDTDAITDDRRRLEELNKLAWSLADVATTADDTEQAKTLASRAKRLAESLRDTAELAHSLRTIGICEAKQHNDQAATQILLEAYKLAQRNADEVTEMHSLRCLANSYYNLGDYTLALAHSLEILELARRLLDRHAEAFAFNLICKTQITIGSYHESLENALRNLELLESMDSSYEEAFHCYTNLGLTHRYLESFDRAHYFFRKSLDVAEHGQRSCLKAEALANLADTYNLQDEHTLAFAMLDRARDLLETCDDVTVSARTLISIGATLIKEDKLDAALHMLQRSLSLLEQTPHVHQQIWALEHIGEVHLKQQDYPLALHYFMQVLNLAEISGSKKYIYRVHYWFSQTYEALGDTSKALEHYKLFDQVKEEVLSQVNAQKLRSTVIQFDLERAERDKEMHKRNNLTIVKAYQELDKTKRAAEDALVARTAILESIADGFISLTDQFRFRYLNPVAEAYWQKKATQLLGRSLWQEMPEIGSHKSSFERVDQRGEAERFELKVRGGNWLEVRLFPAEEGVSMYFTDITERKKAEVDREHYLKLVQAEHERAAARLREAERLQVELDKKNQELDKKNRELIRLSVQDGLTGLYNRRYLDNYLANEFASVKRYQHPLTVCLCDIDHFKNINDSFSHAVGDQVLRYIAKILIQQTRETDLVARYGGEEFVIAFTNTILADALAAATKIREFIETYPWQQVHPDLSVTLSGGLCADTSVDTYEQMLSIADKKLYEAKDAGRNQVIS